MTSNLKVGFRERQCKRLSESIAINPSHSKKARPTLSLDSLSKPTLPNTAAIVASGSDEKLSSIGDIPYHEMRKPFIISGSVSEDSFECPNPSPHHPKSIYIPSWEEVFKVMRRILSFTEMEPPVQDMEVLFPATQRIQIEVDEDPN